MNSGFVLFVSCMFNLVLVGASQGKPPQFSNQMQMMNQQQQSDPMRPFPPPPRMLILLFVCLLLLTVSIFSSRGAKSELQIIYVFHWKECTYMNFRIQVIVVVNHRQEVMMK